MREIRHQIDHPELERLVDARFAYIPESVTMAETPLLGERDHDNMAAMPFPSFYEPSDFKWTSSFASQFADIRDEVEKQYASMTPLYPQHAESLSGERLSGTNWFGRILIFFTL